MSVKGGLSMVVKRFGQWDEAERLTSRRAQIKLAKVLQVAVRQEAELARKLLIVGIRKQAPGGKQFRKLAPSTLMKRRFTGFRGRKALIVRGDLRNSIVTKHFPKASFVGVLRTAKSRDGKSLVNIMEIQEEGRTIAIPITKKMIRFFGAMMRKAGNKRKPKGSGTTAGLGTILIIKIPARPVFAPVFDRHFRASQSRKRIANRVATLLKGKYGFVSAK